MGNRETRAVNNMKVCGNVLRRLLKYFNVFSVLLYFLNEETEMILFRNIGVLCKIASVLPFFDTFLPGNLAM